jgi:hypothetical protein
MLAIRLHALGQVSQVTHLFKESGGLNTTHIMMCLNILSLSSFVPNKDVEIQSNAQFKLFSMIGQLHKFKVPGSELRKGFCKENELWIMRVAKLVSKIVASHLEKADHAEVEGEDKLDLGGVLKQFKSTTKFVTKNIVDARLKASELIGEKDDKQYHHLVTQVRQLISLENLFLNLALVSLIPQNATDTKSVVETLEDIEELKECFKNLGIDKVN